MYTMSQEGNALVYRWDGEVLSIQHWGENSFRVRSTVLGELEDTDYALLPAKETEAQIHVEEYTARIVNGKITAVLTVDDWSKSCDIAFYNQKGELLLKERGRGGALDRKNRFFKPIITRFMAALPFRYIASHRVDIISSGEMRSSCSRR